MCGIFWFELSSCSYSKGHGGMSLSGGLIWYHSVGVGDGDCVLC